MNNSFSNIKTIAPKSFIESVAGSGRGFVTLSYTQDPKTKFLKSECVPASDRDLILDRAAELHRRLNRRPCL